MQKESNLREVLHVREIPVNEKFQTINSIDGLQWTLDFVAHGTAMAQ